MQVKRLCPMQSSWSFRWAGFLASKRGIGRAGIAVQGRKGSLLLLRGRSSAVGGRSLTVKNRKQIRRSFWDCSIWRMGALLLKKMWMKRDELVERWYQQSLGGRKKELCGPAGWSPGWGVGKAGLILINRLTTLNMYIHPYAGTGSGPRCSVGREQKVVHHLGYKSELRNVCPALAGRIDELW